jgi:hypothetical protein
VLSNLDQRAWEIRKEYFTPVLNFSTEDAVRLSFVLPRQFAEEHLRPAVEHTLQIISAGWFQSEMIID